MKTGKYQPLIVGTDAFFNQKSKMKHFFGFILALIFLFLSMRCGAKKNIQEIKNPAASTQKAVLLDTIVYNSQSKSNRKTFFQDSENQTKWVDSVYQTLDLEAKIGQLFMVAAYSNKDEIHFAAVDKLIQENKIGGLIFFQGGPVRQAKLTNRFQKISKLPVFIGNDAEWGLNMRLDSTHKYPWNMTLGAIRDLKLIEKLGTHLGQECKRMGIHFNFAPVLDINTNPKNPIIGVRSFGEDKIQVTDHAIALMTGIQSQGVLATGKHFPGHGDTEADSHSSLPIVSLSKERINTIELYPYKRLFDEGLESVMVAHLNVPSLELLPKTPTSLSYNVISNLLQKELGFDGLVFTDALNMKGVTNSRKPGELDLQAFKAGNDILLFPENVPLAYEKICQAVQDSSISEARLEKSVKKILKYKFKAGLNKYKPIEIENLFADLNPERNNALQYLLYENATTVIKNEGDILPIKNLNQKIAYLKMGDDNNLAFISTLKKYTQITEVSDTNLDSLKSKLKTFDKVIIGVHKSDKAWKKQDLSDVEVFWLQEISKSSAVILDVFAKPYLLSSISDFSNFKAVLLSYQNAEIAQEVAAEIVFGAISSHGKLPVTINSQFPLDFGLQTQSLNRLGFTSPQNVGMDSKILAQIETVAQKAIADKCTPGMQILVARKGKVIYQKAFGFHTYDNQTKVKTTDIYDVASVSKIISTLPNFMQLYDQNKVTLETELGEALPIFKNSNKEHINFKNLLSHYAGLPAWIPFYKTTIDSAKMPLTKYYSKTQQPNFIKKVSDSLFIRNDYHDTILKQIVDTKLSEKVTYKYSDFTFIILKEYLEKATGKTLDDLSYTNFYNSLGMNNTKYNPLQTISKNQIVPTEIDTYFRHSLLQGYVHDMEAAMEGGIAGHAGIFSNSTDIAKIMQMYLQKGTYGGVTYFSPATFDTFNTCHFCSEGNRRGLGFDKPQLTKEGPTCGCVASTSFGHTGFTGIFAWADPQSQLLYIFLSNRTFPDSNAPNKLAKSNIRENIQQIIQNAIIKE